MANTRQIRLVSGSDYVDLNTTPYAVVAGSWLSLNTALEFTVLVQASALTTLDRYVAAIQRLATRIGLYDQQMIGEPVEIWTKTCDDLSVTAELGATWQKKRVKSASLRIQDPSTSAVGNYAITVALSLEVEELWRRAAPESVLEVAAAADVSLMATGALQVGASKSLTGRRIGLTTSGFTVRVRWDKSSNNACTFFQMTGTDLKAWWDGTKFNIQDDTAPTPNTAQSSSYAAYPSGTEIDVVFVWDFETLAIFVNGVRDGFAEPAVTITLADTYTVMAPSSSAQNFYSLQIWPVAFVAAYATGLYAWGRPEMELAYCVPPAADTNTAALYQLYNIPGDAVGALRLILDGAAQDYAMLKAGLRALRIPTTLAWECEDGTNGTDTLDAADATASGGNVAQFTPTGTAAAVRSTIVLCADPGDVAALQGEHRLYLAVKDNAASVGLNLIKWRLCIAGQYEDYSDEFSTAAVNTYSLMDLGPLRLPPGQWPVESITATTDVHAGSYVTLELSVRNTAGAGTFNLDAAYLLPAEAEGTLTGTFDVSAWYEVLDFTGERPAFIGAADYRSLEFAAWADYTGDRLDLAPGATGGALALRWYRDANEEWYPADTCDVFLYYEPRWRR